MECCLSAWAGNSLGLINKPPAWYGFLAKRLHSYSNEAAGMSQEGEITPRSGGRGRLSDPRLEDGTFLRELHSRGSRDRLRALPLRSATCQSHLQSSL